MASIEEAFVLVEKLREIEKSHSAPLDAVPETLLNLKKYITTATILNDAREDPNEYAADLLLARETYELAAILSTRSNDLDAFDKYISLVKPYYFDYGKYLPESPRLHYILGLNLLRLLSSNRIAEFHTELELISYENQDNPFIKHPIQLEQYLMEGCYNKVLETKEEFPSASYVYFMNQLIDTIRDEIAECIQAAYLTLPVQGAKRLLLFETEEQVLDFSQKREHPWKNEMSVFNFENDELKRSTSVPATPLIQRGLSYARELERIV